MVWFGNAQQPVLFPQLTFITTSLPNATVNTPYFFHIQLANSSGPVVFNVSGSTGNWLSINSSGNLSGTPTALDTETVTITAQDGRGAFAQATYTLNVTGGTLQVTTASLTNATVGAAYSFQLQASGGTPPYRWNTASIQPNRYAWLTVSPTGGLQGTPQHTDPMTVVVQVNDALNATAQATLALNTTVSGALAIVTSSLPSAPTGAYYAALPLASGGIPPYRWFISVQSGTTTFTMDPHGLLTAAPTVAGSNPVTIGVTDNSGITVTSALSVTVNSALTLKGVDNVDNLIRLPQGYASTKYGSGALASPAQRFWAAGGTPPYTFSLTGSLNGLTVGSSGTLTGTPASAGALTATLQVTDNASNTATAPVLLNVASQDKVSRPAYNTGSGFFVHSDGTLRDPSGFRFTMKGFNREHFDSGTNPNQGANIAFGTAAPNAVRYGMFTLNNATTPNAATYVTGVQGVQQCHIAKGQFPIVAAFYTVPAGLAPTPGDGNSVQTTGKQSLSDLAGILGWFATNVGTFSGSMNNLAVNLANEFGAPSNTMATASSVWANMYTATPGVAVTSVTVSSSAVITVNSNAATNPFANALYVSIFGASGTINGIVGDVTATGGAQGAWTVTTDINNTGNLWTSGGTLYGGAVGIMRAAGYTCPLVIDGGYFGSNFLNAQTYGQQINASDPLQNCIFNIHEYNNYSPFQGQIASVTTGATTVLHLNSTAAQHPFLNVPSNFFPEYQVTLYGMAGGTWSTVNGQSYAVTNSNFGGSSGNWTVTIPLNSTGLGTYTANSGKVYDYANALESVKQWVALRSQGVCGWIEEFGPYSPSNTETTPTSLSAFDVIDACEAYGIGWNYWVFDDKGQFGCLANTTTYAFNTPSDLTVNGQQLFGHPRLGIWATNLSAPTFL